jgi:cytochrome P450
VSTVASSPESAGIDLSTIDLFDARLHGEGDPHAIWAAMRRKAPVHHQRLADGRAFRSVTRYKEVAEVLRDHTRFTSRNGTLLSILGQADPAGDKMLAASDPPIHTAMREPLTKVLSFAALQSRRPRIRRIVHRLLAALLDGGTWDIGKSAQAFPMAFMGGLMGLPESDWAELARLSAAAVAPDDPAYRESGSHGAAVAAHHQLFSYFSGRVGRRADHDDGLLGFLSRMRVAGRPMRHDEIVYNCYSLLLGANVTTPQTAAGTVLALTRNPGELRRLAADPALVDSGVEEGLRWVSPASHFMRHVVADTELAGVRLKKGEAVVAWIGSANRDEAVFADPYRFDVGRSPNRHLAFGFGPHYCIGAPLARMALRLFLEEFVNAVESVEVAGPVVRLHSNFVAGFTSVPVRARLRQPVTDALHSALTADGPLPV